MGWGAREPARPGSATRARVAVRAHPTTIVLSRIGTWNSTPDRRSPFATSVVSATLGTRYPGDAAMRDLGNARSTDPMSVTDNLIADEAIVFESKKHWMAPLRDSLDPRSCCCSEPSAPRLARRRMQGRAGRRRRQPDGPGPDRAGDRRHRLDRLQHHRVADGRVRGDQPARHPRGRVHLQAPVGDAPRDRDRRQVPGPGPRRTARLRRPHHPHPVGRGRLRHVHDHHQADRVPRPHHGQEDGRHGRDRRRPGRRDAQQAAAAPPRLADRRQLVRAEGRRRCRDARAGSPNCATAGRSRRRTSRPRRPRSSPGCSPRV